MNEDVKLNDSVIAHFVKIIQLGLITGTDIVDHFRMVRLQLEDDELYLNKNYEEKHETNIERMLDEATTQQKPDNTE